jgi:WD40 repeat protein
MVVAAADGFIHVRSVASPDLPIGDFTVDEQPTSVAVSADARWVAVGTDRGTVDVWSLERRNRTARYSQAHAYEVRRIAFSHDGARVISADTLQIKEWAVEAAEQQESPAMHAGAAGEVRVTADRQKAVAVLEDGRLGVWKLRTGAPESALPPAPGPRFGDGAVGPARGLALAANALRLLAWNDKLLAVWDLAAGAGLGSQSAVDVHDAAITPDGAGVVYVSDMSIILWKLDHGGLQVLGTYEGDRPGYVAISTDGKCALSTGGDRQVHLWRLDGPTRRQKYEELRREMKRTSQIDPDIIDRRFQTRFAPDASYWPDAHDKPARAAFVGPDDAIVTTGGGELFVLDLRSERARPVFLADRHRDGVCRILVQADGRDFVTSSWDGAVRFWELGKRESLAVLDAHPGLVESVSASAGRMLLRTRDGILKIVSLPDDSLLAAFQADKQIISCDADAELQWVAALDQGGQMHFFYLENSRCLPQES